MPERTQSSLGLMMSALVVVAVVCGCGCSGSTAAPTQDQAGPPPPAAVPQFDGARALQLVRDQCAFGPRNPGSEGHAQMLPWLVAQIGQFAQRVLQQDFQATTAFGGPYDFCNVLAWLGPEEGEPFLLMAHWDTRPVADEDPDPGNRNQPILGANDGGSGVAVLLEMARLMAQTAPPRPIILAFVDAEDSGQPDSDLPHLGFCLGSEYLAEHWPDGWAKPAEGVLVDLVGGDGKDIERIPAQPFHGNLAFDLELEGHSLEANPALVNTVWSTAERLGHAAFVRRSCGPITDDHLAFIEAGIPVIDILEVFPLTWHTVDDTSEHCSADSLGQVGDTLMHVIYEEL